MVSACNRGYDTDNHFTVQSHWNTTQQAWYPARSYYSGNEPTSYCVELPFVCRAFDKVSSTTNLKCLVWLGQESNPGQSQTRSECFITRVLVLVWILCKSKLMVSIDQFLSGWVELEVLNLGSRSMFFLLSYCTGCLKNTSQL